MSPSPVRVRTRSRRRVPVTARQQRLDVVDVLAYEVGEIEAGHVTRAAGCGRGPGSSSMVRQQSRALLERRLGLFADVWLVIAGQLLDAQLDPGEHGAELVACVLGEAALGAEETPRSGRRCGRGPRRSVDLRDAAAGRREREVTVAESASRSERGGRAGRRAVGSGSGRDRAPRRALRPRAGRSGRSAVHAGRRRLRRGSATATICAVGRSRWR